jgi:hypothetical protein
VLAVAIVGGGARLRRIGDQGVGAGRLDLAETGDNGAIGRLALALHDADEGIVAAGIEDDQAQALGAVRRRHQPLQRNRFVIGVAVAGEPRIDRNEIIDAADFEAVAGIIDHGDVGLVGCSFEFADRTLEFEIADIDLDVDGIEAGIPEHLGDRACVPRGDRKLGNGLVARIADHQRHALLGPGSSRRENHRKDGSPDRGRQWDETVDHALSGAA